MRNDEKPPLIRGSSARQPDFQTVQFAFFEHAINQYGGINAHLGFVANFEGEGLDGATFTWTGEEPRVTALIAAGRREEVFESEIDASQLTVKHANFTIVVDYFRDSGHDCCISFFQGDEKVADEWLSRNFADDWRTTLECLEIDYDGELEEFRDRATEDAE